MDFFKKKTANKDKEAGTLRLFFFSNNPTAVNEMIRYAPLLPKHYMKLIGTASDAHRAIRNVNRLKPNVFIVDIDTEPDAVDCFMMLEERKYNTYIFVTTKIQDDAHKKVLLNAGADYVHKKDKNFTLWDVVPTLKMLGYFQFPRGFDQQIAVEYKDGDDREYSATKIKPSPLYRELYDDAAVIEEECPGVQYLCIERRGGRPTEYYIVEKNSPVISGEAKRYGKPFSDRPDLLMYVMDDVADGKAIIEYEIKKYHTVNEIHKPGDESLKDFTPYAAELNPEYFGMLLPPRSTPAGITLRWRSLMNGVYLHETEKCELVVSVCPPLCEHDFSEYAHGLGAKSEDCLFFREQDACVALFELAQICPALKTSDMIDWPALMTAIWKYHPEYAVSYNIGEQKGFHDPTANLLNTLGIESEAEIKAENMISFSAEGNTDYLFF